MSCSTAIDACIDAYIVDNFDFPDSTIIKRPTAVESDGAGGERPTSGDGFATVATVLGLLTTTRWFPREGDTAMQIAAAVNHKWYGPATTDVRQQDRLVIDGRTFEVQGVSKDASGMPLEAYLVERQIGQEM